MTVEIRQGPALPMTIIIPDQRMEGELWSLLCQRRRAKGPAVLYPPWAALPQYPLLWGTARTQRRSLLLCLQVPLQMLAVGIIFWDSWQAEKWEDLFTAGATGYVWTIICPPQTSHFGNKSLPGLQMTSSAAWRLAADRARCNQSLLLSSCQPSC